MKSFGFTSMRYAVLILLVSSVVSSAERSIADANLSTMSEFSPTGNKEVKKHFDAYLKLGTEAGVGCKASVVGPRVIISGFGLFQGVTFNVSGAIVANLASQTFWPDDLDPAIIPNGQSSVAPILPKNFKLAQGLLKDSKDDVQIFNRILTIDGQKVNACLIVVDVLWDLGGAILANEMQNFQPQAVIMTGLGGNEAVIEAGAMNQTRVDSGFYANGQADPYNSPIKAPILPDFPSSHWLKMTWNQGLVASYVAAFIKDIGVVLMLPPSFRPENDYICNNISYIALHAGKSDSLNLAGGQLILNPHMAEPPQIGFFHYPASAKLSLREAPKWAEVLLGLVRGALASSFIYEE